MASERVTVLDLMAQASESVPDTGAAVRESTVDSRQSTGPPDEGLEERIERLSGELETFLDPRERAVAEELVGAVLEVHGEGLARMLELVGEEKAKELADDPTVGSVLLIHDLYPVPLEQRVTEALDSVRPYMESHGGNVELLGIEDGVARLRLQGSCSGCAASSATLELAIKQALMDAAPDLLGMDVEGVEEEPTHEPPVSGTAAAAGARRCRSCPAGSTSTAWSTCPTARSPSPAVGETDVLVANVNGTLLAYRDECASCGAALAGGALEGGELGCPSCASRFDLPRAGRGVDDSALQLAPIPLLRDGATRVRVALAT